MLVAVLAAAAATSCLVRTGDGRTLDCRQRVTVVRHTARHPGMARATRHSHRRTSWVCTPAAPPATTTAPPVVVPAGRYRGPVFDAVVARPVQVFTTVAADPTVTGGPAYDVPLEFQRFEPAGDPMASRRKAVVLLNGGGWVVGDDDGRAQQEPAARTWARAGWVAFTVEYPVYPDVFADAGNPALVAKYLAATAQSARTTLVFLQYLDAHAAEWGVDAGAVVLAGWSAGGVITLETLRDSWRAEGFTRFPKFYLSLSGDWPDAATAPLNRSNAPSAAMVGFTTDSGYTDAYRPDYPANCGRLAAHGVPCTVFSFPGTGHNLWSQDPDGTESPWGGPVVECFGTTPAVENCSPNSRTMPLADTATPQG